MSIKKFCDICGEEMDGGNLKFKSKRDKRTLLVGLTVWGDVGGPMEDKFDVCWECVKHELMDEYERMAEHVSEIQRNGDKE